MIESFLAGRKLLVAVAHNDDVEFIFGGTLARLAESAYATGTEIAIATFASREANTGEDFESVLDEQQSSFNELAVQPSLIENFKYRARFLPDHEDDVRLTLHDIKKRFNPSIIVTHYLNDPNQDHASLSRQIMRVFRDKTILGGEVSNTGESLQPNVFIELNERHIKAKHAALCCYKSECHKFYFDWGLMSALARVRGAYSGHAEYAEAFELYRLQV